MALRALLLSPDDQAIHAITSVLEEMSVTCDRPLDGATAAKKLNSEHFDLVVVDCDNLPAAKLIFDVCRRSHGGASVPVAIVDGRAGLPTAFRLGAELILTKPVSTDQARVTIRTAVGRAKKDHPVLDVKPADAANAASVAKEPESTVPKALAAAAGAGSSVSTQSTVAVAAPALAATPVTAKVGMDVPAVAAEATAAKMSSFGTAPVPTVPPAISKPIVPEATTVKHPEKQPVLASVRAVTSLEQQLSEDPVMAELENGELKQSSTQASVEAPKSDRSRGLWIGTLLLAVAGGAGYAAWMYQPSVRKFIELRIEQGKTLLGMQTSTNATRSVTPPPHAEPTLARQPVSSTVAPPAPQSSTEITTSESTNTEAAPATPAANKPGTMTIPNAVSTPQIAPTVPANSSVSTEPAKKIAELGTPPTDFPELKHAVILSSKGAEKRLLHRVKPVVTAEARERSAEATVVLKALIDENGIVKALQPVEGGPAVTEAAIKAVKQWRYKPYTRDGKALPFQTIVLVDLQ